MGKKKQAALTEIERQEQEAELFADLDLRRVAKIRCSFEMLSLLFSGELGTKPGSWIETNAPSDLQVISIESGGDMASWVYCESASFEVVAKGAEPPEMAPIIWRLITVKFLSEAYAKRREGSYDFAMCHSCDEVFIDDVILYGSLNCPTPGCLSVLKRGIKEISKEGYFSDGKKETGGANRD